MDHELMLVFAGGVVSLVTYSVSLLIQHFTEVRKLTQQLRQHPTTIVYDKQKEFVEKFSPIFRMLSKDITSIGFHSIEGSPNPAINVGNLMGKNSSLEKFSNLIDEYYPFLSSHILSKANDLFLECGKLRSASSFDKVDSCLCTLNQFLNALRNSIGVDDISKELLNAFNIKKRNLSIKKLIDEWYAPPNQAL